MLNCKRFCNNLFDVAVTCRFHSDSSDDEIDWEVMIRKASQNGDDKKDDSSSWINSSLEGEKVLVFTPRFASFHLLSNYFEFQN